MEAPNPLASLLQGAPPRMDAAAELDGEMENPAGEAEGTELLVPASLFPKGCKEGDVYTVKGVVGKMGSKVGFTPTEAFKPAAPEAAQEETAQ